MRGLAEAGDDVRDGVAFLVAEVHGREALKRHVDRLAAVPTNPGKGLHRGLRLVGPKRGLAANPVGTLAGNGALCQLVAKLNLELAAVQAALALSFRDMKLALFLLQLVRDLIGHKGG